MFKKLTTISALVAAARAQQVCTLTTETHPSLSWQTCSSSGCTTNQGSVVIDSNWRWTHITSGSTNCYTGNTWNATVCPNGQTCATNCCLDGADYSGTYGITASGNSLSLKFVTKGPYSTNIGSRTYLMQDENNYAMFNLLGKEFTFDVDVSNLPCGLNGALYFVSMDQDGGKSKYSGNKAGAKYGTGYCDSQCPRDIKFIGGVANVEGWTPSSNDANAGVGNKGVCCAEMDIWEANKMAAAYTPHPCTNSGFHVCNGDSCGGTYSSDRYAGDCDPDGCDFNSYRQGNTTFFGPGSSYTIDTTKKVTVVTQFIASGGTLSEIKRFYVQNGVVIPNSQSTISGVTGNSITTDYCNAQKTAFGDQNIFSQKGGLSQMGSALNSMVLVMSIWDDHHSNMLWLDSTYPVGSTKPGAARGSCATSSGVPSDVETNAGSSSVTYSNIKFGSIGSTFNNNGGSPGTSTTTSATGTTSTQPASSGAAHWGQCGGIGWNGPTTCVSPYTCTVVNAYYSQCL